MAEAAASKIAGKVYNKKVDDLKNLINKNAEGLCYRYIPADVLEFCKNYPDYIETVHYVSITTYVDNEKRHALQVTAEIKLSIPYACRLIVVLKDEYDYIRKLNDQIHDLYNKRHRLKDEAYQTLLALKYEKAVMESFPEAKAFLDFPAPPAPTLPATNCNNLRELLKNAE